MSRLLRWVSFLLLLTIAPLSVSAQEIQSVSARELVVQAMRNTSTLFSYRFTVRYENTNTYTIAGDQSYSYVISTIGDGSASATGNFSIAASLRIADTVENLRFIAPLRYERNFVNGEVAYKFWTDGTVYEGLVPFTSGWHSSEMLEAAIAGTEFEASLGSLHQIDPPADFLDQIDMINSVREDEPEIINNVHLRVFDIEIDALGALLARSSNRRREALEAQLENPRFREEFEMTSFYRLWISEEDQRIHRGLNRSMFNLPYLSAGYGDERPYDWRVESESGFTIFRHNQPVHIERIELQNG